MKIEIYTIVKNGEYIIPLYLKHYMTAFSGCVINIFDNNSTDRTVAICASAGCVINNFPEYDVFIEQEFKNTIWKNSSADWIIVCDQDELLMITQNDLELMPAVNVIQFKGHNMVDQQNLRDPELFTHAFPSETYDKCCMFRKNIQEINYSIGSHHCKPVPIPRLSKLEYNLFHYNKHWFTLKDFCKKHLLPESLESQRIYNILTRGIIKIK